MQQSSARTGDPQFVLSWLGGGVHLQGQRSVARAGDRRRVKARERAGGQAADAEIHRPGETLQSHNAEGKGFCSTAMNQDCLTRRFSKRKVARRSEERRVGKECRTRWSRKHQKRKKKETR